MCHQKFYSFMDSLHQLVHCGKLFPHFKLNLEIKIFRFGPIFKYFYEPIFLQFNGSLYWKMFLWFKECFQRILRKMTFQMKIFDCELTLQSWKYSNDCNFSIQIIVENAEIWSLILKKTKSFSENSVLR